MPDLRDIALESFWKSKGPEFASTIDDEERLEDWTIDHGADGTEAVVRVGEALEADPATVKAALRDPRRAHDLQTALAYMKAGRRLRLIDHLVNTGRADYTLLRSIFEGDGSQQGDAMASAIRGSLVLIERRRLISTLFHPDRLDMILKALLDHYEEY